MKNIKIIALVAIVAAIAIFMALSPSAPNQKNDTTPAVVIEGDPVDTVMDFYQPWLAALRDPATDPFTKGVTTHKSLSPAMSEILVAAKDDFVMSGIDPVLCQSIVPEGMRTKTILHQDDQAQILMLTRGDQPKPVAIVKLGGIDGEWKIIDISCEAGEQGPEIGEFSFDHTGRVLKQSVPPPLNPEYWYLIYEQDGLQGFTAALLFNESSTCTMPDGSPTECGDASLNETYLVHIKGNMTEAGVDVVHADIVEIP